MTNEQDWLDSTYEQLKPWIKATSVGDDQIGCLVAMEWAGDTVAEQLAVDINQQIEDRDILVHLLIATVMQYALERRSREVDEERQQKGRGDA